MTGIGSEERIRARYMCVQRGRGEGGGCKKFKVRKVTTRLGADTSIFPTLIPANSTPQCKTPDQLQTTGPVRIPENASWKRRDIHTKILQKLSRLRFQVRRLEDGLRPHRLDINMAELRATAFQLGDHFDPVEGEEMRFPKMRPVPLGGDDAAASRKTHCLQTGELENLQVAEREVDEAQLDERGPHRPKKKVAELAVGPEHGRPKAHTPEFPESAPHGVQVEFHVDPIHGDELTDTPQLRNQGHKDHLIVESFAAAELEGAHEPRTLRAAPAGAVYEHVHPNQRPKDDVGPDAGGDRGLPGAADSGNGAEVGAVAALGLAVWQLAQDLLQELGEEVGDAGGRWLVRHPGMAVELC
ncbi:hypothetical protein BDK51DRAFT_34517 [Blyttiomyces helicus]|uniref:Uncharacterized protein n=1 Tax=Blyttiomyces helicus TaxID=388810 RepID=A0A4P9W6B6_9FUNG|nr:hypothetical protein BDK51DRAFT_34517 [Blyttiomyces helicus]|eukprot:RKO87999.1 hypothetical protein BDK51DRAFT_34517 [Blyttiomyces helicus]